MDYKVDIISSVFNADEFLDGFFEDIIQQTYFSYCNLILVAPNPTQKLKDLVEKYNFPNIILIELEDDPGISKCLNIAINNSVSEYITIANTDDRKRKDSIERHCQELDNNPYIDLVYGISLITHKANDLFDNVVNNPSKQEYPCYMISSIKNLLLHNSPHNNPMWRRSMTDKNGLFDESLKFCADFELWLRCMSTGSKFKRISEELGLYYWNPTGMSTNRKLDHEKRKEEIYVRARYN